MHYRADSTYGKSTVKTVCGATAPSGETTSWLHRVTCPECLKVQEKKMGTKGMFRSTGIFRK